MKPQYLRELRTRYRSELSAVYPLSEIDSIFWLLIEAYFGYPRTVLAMEPGKELDAARASRLLKALEGLKAYRPVQYILGHAHFMDMQLAVNPDVLIPRPETEGLAAWVIEQFPDRSTESLLLDVGTGSGCIALGIKMHLPHFKVYGMDISDAALKVARSNALSQNLEVRFFQGDVQRGGQTLPEFDVIVSNPPYVPRSEAAAMQKHVSNAEPHLALFVPDEDPLLFYRYLCDFAKQHLKKAGCLYVETHERYTEAVAGLLGGSGFTSVEVKKDIFDKDRFVRGCR